MTMPPRSIPPVTSTGDRASRGLRSADPKRLRTRQAGQGQQQNPNTHDPVTGEQYHDQYGAASVSPQSGKSRGPISWGGGIGSAQRGAGGGGVGSATAPGSYTYTKGQHLMAAKSEKRPPHKALSCATCGASDRQLNGSVWYRGVWWVDCLPCDGRQMAKEAA